MTVRVRFAPSPTGKIHVGNIRAALFNWMFARSQGGAFVLRIDDTDFERSKPEYEDGIETDLKWLGLTWDEKFSQSKRGALYDAARDRLIASGHLYPCYETGEELDRKRKVAQARGRPPVYDRAALALTDDEKRKLEADGRHPHWRFKLSGKRVVWTDLVRGDVSIDTASLSDPVLIREDGAYLYTLPSVLDDVDLRMTHVIRGEDHVTNTGVQIEIFEALGAPVPTFGHYSLLVGADGEALSKRLGSLSISDLRESGLEPIALLSHLARLGTSDPVEARPDHATIAAEFSLSKVSRAPARFDPEELKRVNAQVLHHMPYDQAKQRLGQVGADLGEAFWNAVRQNLTTFSDVTMWSGVVQGTVSPVISDPGFAQAARAVLPQGPYGSESWSGFVEAVKSSTGAKGKALFMPLRLALTGQEHGPDMATLFALIGPDKAAKRLEGQAA
jgi:glutamyl-tRNA synthetase